MAAWDPGILMNDAGLPVWEGFGLPGPRTLDECSRHNWWIRDRCFRYAILLDDSAVGFATVCAELRALPYAVPDGTEWEVLDFYVAPKARRSGVGLEAAKQLLARHRGAGILFTLAGNDGARAFWRTVLDAHARDVVESADATEFRFVT
jgi:predicted acetyltransferase